MPDSSILLGKAFLLSSISVIEQQEPGLCVCILVEEGDRLQRKSKFKDQTEIKPSSPKSK